MTEQEISLIKSDLIKATEEICDVAHLKAGDILVVGCSTSEVVGSKIGTNSDPDTAKHIFDGVYGVLKEKGILVRHFTKEKIKDFNRITIGSEEEMKVFVETIKQLVKGEE